MPWCPVCRTEYELGRVTCADCGEPLVDVLPPESGAQIGEPVVVLEANSAVEAQVAEATLEASGIPAYVQQPGSLVPNVDFDGDEPPELEVMVSAEDAEEAVAVLKEPPLGEEELAALAEGESSPGAGEE